MILDERLSKGFAPTPKGLAQIQTTPKGDLRQLPTFVDSTSHVLPQEITRNKLCKKYLKLTRDLSRGMTSEGASERENEMVRDIHDSCFCRLRGAAGHGGVRRPGPKAKG